MAALDKLSDFVKIRGCIYLKDLRQHFTLALAAPEFTRCVAQTGLELVDLSSAS